jgi:hypothetical protein
VLGWLADSFRFAWALLYWNVRKSWFRLRRGRVPCPCQSPSDSGRAYETGCDACLHWHKPERFHRVCPLLVRTEHGLRCSANTEDVRPFWGIPARYYGGTLLGVYAVGVISVFAFLRTIGYPVSIVHVGFPPLWHRVGEARGWYFTMRSQKAFSAGRTNEGLLYLANAYEFDPSNYDIGLALAKTFQIGQPGRSDDLYASLLAHHPNRREETGQLWLRALLARGDFARVDELAFDLLRHNSPHANAWMRALVFASRQSGDDAPLRTITAAKNGALAPWKRLAGCELLLRAGRKTELRPALDADWGPDAPPFTVLYRVEALASLGDNLGALDLLERLKPQIDGEAYLTYRLHCLSLAGLTARVRSECVQLLGSSAATQPLIKLICAQLIRHPDAEVFGELLAKISREQMPFNDATAGGWYSLLCTAGAVGRPGELHALTEKLREASAVPFNALFAVETFFRGEVPDHRATWFLPILPVPLEIVYALIERYPTTEVKDGRAAK